MLRNRCVKYTSYIDIVILSHHHRLSPYYVLSYLDIVGHRSGFTRGVHTTSTTVEGTFASLIHVGTVLDYGEGPLMDRH